MAFTAAGGSVAFMPHSRDKSIIIYSFSLVTNQENEGKHVSLLSNYLIKYLSRPGGVYMDIFFYCLSILAVYVLSGVYW